MESYHSGENIYIYDIFAVWYCIYCVIYTIDYYSMFISG